VPSWSANDGPSTVGAETPSASQVPESPENSGRRGPAACCRSAVSGIAEIVGWSMHDRPPQTRSVET
jgi:hypothetical protein